MTGGRQLLITLTLLAAAPVAAQNAEDVRNAFDVARSATESKARHMAEGTGYYFDGPVTSEAKQVLKQVVAITEGMRVVVVTGVEPRVTYQPETNRVTVSEGTLATLRERVGNLPEPRRGAAIRDALTGLIVNQTVKALYAGPEIQYPVRPTTLLYIAAPGARYALLDQPATDPRAFIEVVARGGPLSQPSTLTSTPHGSKWMAHALRTAEAGIFKRYGFTVEVVESSTAVAVDAETMRLKVSRATLDQIESLAKSQSTPFERDQYRRAAINELLGETAARVRGAYHETSWEKLYERGTMRRLLAGDVDPALRVGGPRMAWKATIDALDRGLRGSYNLVGEQVYMNGLRLDESRQVELRFDSNTKTVRVTTGFLAAIEAEARLTPQPKRFARELLADMVNRAGSRATGVGDTYGPELIERGRKSQLRDGKHPAGPSDFRPQVENLGRTPLAENVRLQLESLKPLAERLPFIPEPGEFSREQMHEPKRKYVSRQAYEAERLAELRANYRRPNGRLDWTRLAKDKALHEGGALGSFAMALFLKELAVVAKTGDAERIGEFFDGLTEIGFYKEYGLFALGARAGDVAYSKFLQRHVRPVFVNGIIKTNVVLATGLALPRLVEGDFSGEAFAISFGSLGLSSAAVRTAVAPIKWVKDVRSTRATTTVGRVASGARRVARVGGWFYTAAELAVVLYLAEDIEERVHTYLDRESALDAMQLATGEFLAAINAASATPEDVEAAARALRDAGSAYRDYLYRPLLAADAELSHELTRIAREAKLSDDRTSKMLAQLETVPALRAHLEAKGDTVASYVKRVTEGVNAEIGQKLDAALEKHQARRDAMLADVYQRERRGGRLLEGVDDAEWIAGGAGEGASNDPFQGSGVLARRGRDSTRRAFLREVRERLSDNRLQSYEDEAELLALAKRALASRGLHDQAAAIERVAELTRRTASRDQALYRRLGASEVLERSLR